MSSASYELKSFARCLVPQTADDTHHNFIAATCNLRGPNEVRIYTSQLY